MHVLKSDPQTLFAASSLKASFELWHLRLVDVSFDIILTLNKRGCLSVTSILPIPTVCSSCAMAKSHKVSFDTNENRASHVLDMIHCDL